MVSCWSVLGNLASLNAEQAPLEWGGPDVARQTPGAEARFRSSSQSKKLHTKKYQGVSLLDIRLAAWRKRDSQRKDRWRAAGERTASLAGPSLNEANTERLSDSDLPAWEESQDGVSTETNEIDDLSTQYDPLDSSEETLEELGIDFDQPDDQRTDGEGVDDFYPLELAVPSDHEEHEKFELMVREQELLEYEKNCQEELDRLQADRLNSINLDIRITGTPGEDFPFECMIGSHPYQPRQWPQITYMWKASGLCHKPLYFEQVQLERYGHSWGPYVQPIMSGVHFFGTLPILPYKMGIRTPCECVYSLGYYRPGNCAPYMIDPVPFTWRAALFQTGTMAGLVTIFP